jgi:hypothetical protein
MAAVAVNNFKTVTHSLSTGAPTVIYTAPTGYTSVFLLLQITNTDSQTQKFSLYHRRESTDTALQLDSPIVSKDSLDVLPGKLVLQTGDKIAINASSSSGVLKLIASILETSNF